MASILLAARSAPSREPGDPKFVARSASHASTAAVSGESRFLEVLLEDDRDDCVEDKLDVARVGGTGDVLPVRGKHSKLQENHVSHQGFINGADELAP